MEKEKFHPKFRPKWVKGQYGTETRYYHGFYIGEVYYDIFAQNQTVRKWRAKINLPGFSNNGDLGHFHSELNAQKLLEARAAEWFSVFSKYNRDNGVDYDR